MRQNEAAWLMIIVSIFGLAFSIITPIGYGYDEPVHAYKVASLAQGQLKPIKIGPWVTSSGNKINVYGNYVPRSLVEAEQVSNSAKLTATCTKESCLAPSESIQQEVRNSKSQKINAHDSILVDLWGANSYTVIGYIPSALGYKIASTINTSQAIAIYMARYFNVLFCSVIAVIAFTLLRKHRSRWLIFFLTTTPVFIWSFATLGGDGLLISLSLLLISIILKYYLEGRKINNPLMITAFSIASLLPLIKLPYLVISLMVFVLPVHKITTSKYKSTLLYLLLLSIIFIPAISWNIYVSDATTTQSLTTHAGNQPPSTGGQVSYILSNPLGFLAIFIKKILTFDPLVGLTQPTHQIGLSLPLLFTMPSLIVLVIICLLTSREIHKSLTGRGFVLLSISTVGLVFGIIISMYLAYNPVGSSFIDGVQGRYFLPVYAIIAMLISYLINLSLPVTKNTVDRIIFIGVCIIMACLIATTAWYLLVVY